MTLPALPDYKFGKWSDDSNSFLLVGPPPTPTSSSYALFNSAGALVNTYTSPDKNISQNKILRLTSGAHFIITSVTTTPAPTFSSGLNIEPITGSPTVTLSAGQSFCITENCLLDVGNGIVFQEEWGLYFAKYDGTNKIRLDVPRANEGAESGSRFHAAGGISGFTYFDSRSGKIIYTPIISASSRSSTYTPLRSLATASLAEQSGVNLTFESITTGQIDDSSTQPFKVYEEFNLVTYHSRADDFQTENHPSILSLGSLAGGKSQRISPVVAFDYIGSSDLGAVFGVPGQAQGIAHGFQDKQGIKVFKQNISGSENISYPNSKLSLGSLDGQRLLLSTYADSKASVYVAPANDYSGIEPKRISGNLNVSQAVICTGCADKGWSQHSYIGSLTANSQFIMSATAPIKSTFMVDFTSSDVSPVPTDLGLMSYGILPDGLTIIGQTPESMIVKISALNPTVKTTLANGNIAGLTNAGAAVLFGEPSFVGSTAYKSINSYDLKTNKVANLIPSTLDQTWQTNLPIQSSADGTTVLFTYQNPAVLGCTDRRYIVIGTNGMLKTVLSADAKCLMKNEKLSPNGKAVYYLKNYILYSVRQDTDWSESQISETGETVMEFWPTPNGARVLVRAINSSNNFIFYTMLPDGSERKLIASSLPIRKRFRAMQFIRNGAAVLFDIDGLVDGTLELFKFDL